MSREAMQLALEALESDPISHAGLVSRKQAITALRQALTGPELRNQCGEVCERAKLCAICAGGITEQKPVAWISEGGDVSRSKRYMDEMGFKCNPLYTAPPKAAEWVGLTDDVVFELADTNLYEGGKNYGVLAFAKAIEQALKEKNK